MRVTAPRFAAPTKRHNTKYTLGPGEFLLDSLPPELSEFEGIIPLTVILDPTVGEEVALYWFDRTPFMRELAAVRPFQFVMGSGLFRSDFGPLMWLLFYVANPPPAAQPVTSAECILNPFDATQISIFRRLANQTYWHLTLVGANDKVANFFEFENDYDLDGALDTMDAACRSLHVTDFTRASQQPCERFSPDDLYRTTGVEYLVTSALHDNGRKCSDYGRVTERWRNVFR